MTRDNEDRMTRDNEDRMTRDNEESNTQDVLSYYKSFNKNSTNFKKINNISLSDEESIYSSSEDDFPTPNSPHIRNKKRHIIEEDYHQLFNQVKNLSRRLNEIEIKNKEK